MDRPGHRRRRLSVLKMIWRTAISVAIAVAGAMPASADPARVHVVRYVRALTNCFAEYGPRHPQFLERYQRGDFKALTDFAMPFCTTQYREMKNAFDAHYPVGHFSEFVTGPYSADLPRALSVRWQTIVAERRETEERSKSDRDQASRQLQTAAEAARERFYDCARAQLAKTVASGERSELLAQAAMITCGADANAMISAFQTLWRHNAQASGTYDDLRKAILDRVTALAVTARAEASRPAAPQAEPKAGKKDAVAEVALCLHQTQQSMLKGRLVERGALISAITEICRPEIEFWVREQVTADLDKLPGVSVSTLREKHLKTIAKLVEDLADGRKSISD